MIAKILIDLGMDPTVIVGSLLKEQKSNFISGKSKYFIVEACEYRRSFLNIEPKILVITNIDNDHLDYYKDIKDIQSAFHEMAMKVPEDGYIVYFSNDPLVYEVLQGVKAKKVDALDSYSHNMKIAVPGEHNKKDGAMALTVACLLKIDKEKAVEKLSTFSGTWRRFEYKGQTKSGALVYDDYGHHPTEIKATLAGAREYFGNKKIKVVFQPHLFSRTKLLLDDFAHAFSDADEVILAPIYPAREAFDSSISSEILAEKIGPKAKSFPDFSIIEKYLLDSLSENDILMIVGAGDIYKVGEEILCG
jgi:UDP-N-acetylmuramate--alanine ligase